MFNEFGPISLQMVLRAEEERDHLVCGQQRLYVELHQSSLESVQVTESVPAFVIFCFCSN